MHLITIIIPYKNKINYIKKTLESALSQTYKKFEIILIYDDSNIDDLKIIKKIIKKNVKIKIIVNKKNYGAGLSRNIGIKKAKGKYISFLDSDDIWDRNKLKIQMEFIKSKKNLNFVFSNYSKDNKINVISKPSYSYNELLKSCDIGLSTVILKKSIIPDKLFPNLKTKEDFVAWLKILKKEEVAWNCNKNLVTWKTTKNSLSSSIFQKLKDGFSVYYKYQNFSIIKSIIYLTFLSLNSLKKKF